MNAHEVWHVFAKDGRELLRDRRTLFINVVLPVLLYPVLALVFIQVSQLARPGVDDLPRIALQGDHDATAAIAELLPLAHPEADPPDAATITGPTGPSAPSATDPAEAGPTTDPAGTPEGPATGEPGTAATDSPPATRMLRVGLPGGDARSLTTAARRAAATDAPDAELRERLLDGLRTHELSALLVVTPQSRTDGPPDYAATLVLDNAHPKARAIAAAFDTALDGFRRQQVEHRLRERGAPAELLEPLHRHVIEPASASAAARSHLGGAIPVLLVLMAISGAFFPALDLIAGERERGTLESLLSWPGDRRAIFLGKLLVVTVASQLTVMLNLLSLGLTLGIVVATVAGGRDLLSAVGPGTGLGILAIGFVVLLPVNLMLAALSLALAGIANSFKEAQNYLTPLVLVVMALASACLIPDLRPSMLTDMVPVLGPLLALKQSLQSPQPDYLHLGVATAASTALAAVFIGWSVRLLDAERFLYPSLVRAGWGRFRRWGQGPATPGGVEVLGVFAVSFGLFVLAGGLLHPLGPLFATVATLTIAVALPAVVHTWLGAYDRARTLYWRRPEAPVEWLRPVLLVPFCLMMAGGLSQLQIHVMGPPPEQLQMIEQLLKDIRDNYGIVGLMLAVAVAPGVCEELLCRGTLFAGLRRGVGTTGAVMISAFLFGIYHGSPYRFFPQAALGVVLALLVLRSGSIWTAILLHTLYNGTAVAIALAYEHQQAATDAAEAPVVMAEQSAQGPLPALATLALGVVGIVVVFRARRSRRPAAAQSA